MLKTHHLKKLQWFKTYRAISLYLCVLALVYVRTGYSTDLLANTLQDVRDTAMGAGEFVAYIVEGVYSTYNYIKSHNILALTGIVILSLYFNKVVFGRFVVGF